MPQTAVRALGLLLLSIAAATAVFAETPDERDLRQLKEDRWPRAYREGNVALLDSILAKEFRRIGADGESSTKQDELDYVAKNRPSYRAFRFEIDRLEVFENGTAVVSGKGVITGDATDPDAVVEYRSSNVLIKRDGRWQAISSHVSGVKELPKATAATPAATCPPATLTREGLAALKTAGFQVASDEERNRIALLLPQCLGDPDPAMRDGIAFEALSTWLRAPALEPATIRALAARLTPELRAAADPAGFRKPFVALTLAEIARADRLGGSVLAAEARQALVDGAVHFLTNVTDYRGYDPREGWRHGVAHGADLAFQLGMHPDVSAAGVRRLLGAVAAQVAPPRGVAYTFAEPERLARAVFLIHRRGVLDDAFWEEWLTAIGAPPAADAYRSVEGLAGRHNKVAFLHAVSFAGRSAGTEASVKLANLADAQIRRLVP